MDIAVIGTGYVGLTVGTCLADAGNCVICVDKDDTKIKNLNDGKMPIYEPGLEELVKLNKKEKRLFFSSDLTYAVEKSKVCFIAVGTPEGEDGSCDINYVLNAAKEIAKSMNGYKIIIDKSTVPVGTAQKVSDIIKKYTIHSFDVVSNPEFLKQGSAIEDFMKPDRIIIGSNSKSAIAIMKEIYSPFSYAKDKIITMDVKSAELTKYAANSFLAAKISFMNEIANLCEKIGADVEMVRAGISSDTRIGDKFLFPGLGFGGSCIPKDVKALIKIGEENSCKMSIIQSVEDVNKNRCSKFVEKILSYYNGNLTNVLIGAWGLSYKPKTDDMRQAPAIDIINKLVENGAKIKAYDPKAYERAKNCFGDRIIYSKSSYEAAKKADCLILLTEWSEFRSLDFDKVKSLMKTPVIFDGRNQYDPIKMKEKGFVYYSIGRSGGI